MPHQDGKDDLDYRFRHDLEEVQVANKAWTVTGQASPMAIPERKFPLRAFISWILSVLHGSRMALHWSGDRTQGASPVQAKDHRCKGKLRKATGCQQ